MLGTIVNTGTILIGGAFGAIAREGIGEKYRNTLFNALGLACLVLGMNASQPNIAKSEYPVMFILSLAIGGVIGTRLDLAGRIERMNARLNAKTRQRTEKETSKDKGKETYKKVRSTYEGATKINEEIKKVDEQTRNTGKGASKIEVEASKADNRLNGLVTGLLLYCIGTFSIVGPLLSCLSPSQGWDLSEPANTFLYTNATLDLVTSAVLAATYGWIMLWAAPVLFCWQGMFYLIAYYFSSGMPEPMRTELSIVGGVLIVSSGLAILGIKDCKTVNLLPSLLVPVVFYIIKDVIIA